MEECVPSIWLRVNLTITLQGLADYYDKHRAVTQEEQLDAIQTYTKLLQVHVLIHTDSPRMYM